MLPAPMQTTGRARSSRPLSLAARRAYWCISSRLALSGDNLAECHRLSLFDPYQVQQKKTAVRHGNAGLARVVVL